MKELISKLKLGLPKDLGKKFRIRPTATAREVDTVNAAMFVAAKKLEEAHAIVAGLLCDTATFGDRQRAYDWLLFNRPPEPIPFSPPAPGGGHIHASDASLQNSRVGGPFLSLS